MESIFILGASRLQLAAIKEAKKRGLYVYVLDYDPEAVGIAYADQYLPVSTIDKEEVLKAAKMYKPDYITTSTSDMPVRTVSWVCEKLGYKSGISYEDSIAATDKTVMRRRLKECGVPIPTFKVIHNIDEFLVAVNDMPQQFVIKPADNAASRGVVFMDKNESHDWKEVYEYSHQFSRGGDILIEEFMTGPEVSAEAFTVKGQSRIITITDKMITEIPYFVEIGHTEPSRLTEEEQNDIRNVALAAIKAINIQDGPSHTEIKVTPQGAKIVEIAARLGGDFITSNLVPLSTGVNMTECSMESVLGAPVDWNIKYNKGAAIRFIQSDQGVFDHAEGIDKALAIDGIQEIEIYKNSGDNIKVLASSSDRVGHVIALGLDADDAAHKCDLALAEIKVVLK